MILFKKFFFFQFFSINFISRNQRFYIIFSFFFSVFHEKRNTKIQVSSIRNNHDKNYARLTYAINYT